MRVCRFATILTLLLGMTECAAANSITIEPFPFSVTASLTPVTIPVSIPQFDPTQGTLASVRFDFTGATANNTVSFENRASPAIVYNSLGIIADTLTLPGFTIPPAQPFVPPPSPFSPRLAGFDGQADFPGSDSLTSTGVSISGTGHNTFGPPPPSVFLGTGTVSGRIGISLSFLFNAAFASTGAPAPAPAVQLGTPGMITGSFDVVYNTAVPEPHGFVSLGIGILGALVLAFRRRRDCIPGEGSRDLSLP